MATPPKVLRIKEVVNCVGISKSTIERGVINNTFPRPIKLGVRAKGWIESDISQWIEDCSQNIKRVYE